MFDSKLLAAATLVAVHLSLAVYLVTAIGPRDHTSRGGFHVSAIISSVVLASSVALYVPAVAAAPKQLMLFAPAGVWTASIVLSFALLIESLRWWSHTTSFIIWQVVTLAVFFGGIFVASVLHIEVMRQVFGSAVSLYVFVRYIDAPWNKSVFLTVGLAGLSVLLYVAAYGMRTHPEYMIGLF